MKNLFKILLITLLVASCSSNQPGSAIVKDNDELTLNAKELLKSYVENDFSLWEELFSDDCEVRFNNLITDKKSVIEGIKQDHILFNSFVISDEYAHTNYFKDGGIWTNHWFTNTLIGNYTQETTSVRVHTDLKWEDGKIVIFNVYYDPTFQTNEVNAMTQLTE
ncbi:MAG: hypothetical protein CMC72_02355 [Flavobacteriaceae bacterium]|nr:hypothetical protein [Flavobacteriaceae bacterium]